MLLRILIASLLVTAVIGGTSFAQSFAQSIGQPSGDRQQPMQSGFPALTPQASEQSKTKDSQDNSFGPMITTGSSLIVVLGLFAGLVWISRRYGNGPTTPGSLPASVFNRLGSTMIDGQTKITLLRCGNRIVMMAQTSSGIFPLGEITDPVEVNRLTIACTGDTGPTFAETLRSAA